MAVCLRPLGFCSQLLGIQARPTDVKDQNESQDENEPSSLAVWLSGQRAGTGRLAFQGGDGGE